jgi:hypothetical protein
MSASDGPFLNSDGLVFYHDASNTQKSWKGAPTTNLLSMSGWNTNFNGTAPYWYAMTRNVITTDLLYDGVYIGQGITTDAAGHGFGYIDYPLPTGATAGIVYACSFWYKSTGRSASVWCHDVNGLNTAYSATLIADGIWRRGVSLFTSTTSGQVRLHFHTNGGAIGDVVYFTAPMIEQQTFGTPFVNGVRSNTQSIVDLTGNNTITASSLTYNSNGTFSFNGSSNTLNCGNASALSALTGTSNVTVESWVNLSGYGSTSGYGVIAHKGYPWAFLMENPSNTMRIRFYLSGSGDISCPDSATHALNTWYHFVGTYDGSNMRFYRNGVLTNTVAGSGTIGGGGLDMVVGSYSGAYFSQGQIPIVKVYNRTLSAGEINQNFNTLRSRYGI